jgi:serine/threonine protein kinase
VDFIVDDQAAKVYMVLKDSGAQNLEDLIEKKPEGLPYEQVKSLAFQLLQGIETIHKAKICHRDLKPDNILVKLCPETDEVSELTVIDFGISVDLKKGKKMRVYVA